MKKCFKHLIGWKDTEPPKTYDSPNPRPFSVWLSAMGLVCDSKILQTDRTLTYDEFCSYPGVRLIKQDDGVLYGFWRQYGDICGEPRTVKGWLEDLRGEIVNPTEDDLRDLNLF